MKAKCPIRRSDQVQTLKSTLAGLKANVSKLSFDHVVGAIRVARWADRLRGIEMMTIGWKMGISLGLAPFRNLNGCIGGAVVEGWNLAPTCPKPLASTGSRYASIAGTRRVQRTPYPGLFDANHLLQTDGRPEGR
jgi:hypothetical protein